jgi:nicotinamidase-related amidase
MLFILICKNIYKEADKMKKIANKHALVKKAGEVLLNISESFEKLSVIDIKDFSKKDTALVNVDIINGFCKEGNLSSDRVAEIIPEAVRLNEKFREFTRLYFIDKHDKTSEEFNAYIEHCISNTSEAEIIDELKKYIDERAVVCNKNSVNGFFSIEFQNWFIKNSSITNYIVIGDVTDICVLNFCLTLKTYFNEKNIKSRIIVPLSGVETFDLDVTDHDGDIMNLFALYNMRMNGIEIVEDIL